MTDVLGLEDLDTLADSLMRSTLEQGVRRTPGVAEIDAVWSKEPGSYLTDNLYSRLQAWQAGLAS